MKSFLSFLLLLLTYNFSSSVQLIRPTKPTLQEELTVLNFEANSASAELYCPEPDEDFNKEMDLPKQSIFLWNDGLFLQLDANFSTEENAVINSALYDLGHELCINVYVWPKTSVPTGDYVRVIKDVQSKKCSSSLGKQGGEQVVNLGVGCIRKHLIIHQFFHVLGLSHEHERLDRDLYITIQWDNIINGTEKAFSKSKNALTFGVPYDTQSIMHVSSSFLAAPTNKYTIIKKDGGLIARNEIMSPLDKLKLQRMFECK